MKDSVRQQLFRKLKKENCFWSYDMSKMKSISDEALIEHVLLYLDIDDLRRVKCSVRLIFFTLGITLEPNALKLMSKASKLATSTN